ncbi:hypothetical protein K7432_001704 [Basidiobolus ranarum]|uniref:Uncharacterized protein n=1 Tax=Basidiobolus ranarum TaxID=34480 RepID=A0ABR2W906_9FUNG
MIRKNRHRFTQGVVHSFTGTPEEAKEILDLDLYIGINGCSLKTQENLDTVASIPIERMMIETDAPWCDIRPTHASYKYLKDKPELLFESKKKERFELGLMVKSRNEPCTLRQVLEVIAGLHARDAQDVAEIVYQNTCNVFWPNNAEN